jgi:ribosome-binding factor A
MSGDTRSRRANELIREVVAETVQRELSDPRLGFVTITQAVATKDLREAKVWFSTLRPEEAAPTMAALESARGVIQRCIADRLGTRNTPRLTFVYDDLPQRADELTRLIDDVTEPSTPE